MIDPVDHDLNQHLRQVDEAEAKAEAIDEIVDEILEGDCKRIDLKDAVAKWLETDEDAAKTIATAILDGSTDTISDDEIFRGILSTMAEQELERREREAADAAGEAAFYEEQDRLRGEGL